MENFEINHFKLPHINLDITSDKIKDIFEKYRNQIKLVIHTAAQPSHDWAATNPKVDLM